MKICNEKFVMKIFKCNENLQIHETTYKFCEFKFNATFRTIKFV